MMLDTSSGGTQLVCETFAQRWSSLRFWAV